MPTRNRAAPGQRGRDRGATSASVRHRAMSTGSIGKRAARSGLDSGRSGCGGRCPIGDPAYIVDCPIQVDLKVIPRADLAGAQTRSCTGCGVEAGLGLLSLPTIGRHARLGIGHRGIGPVRHGASGTFEERSSTVPWCTVMPSSTPRGSCTRVVSCYPGGVVLPGGVVPPVVSCAWPTYPPADARASPARVKRAGFRGPRRWIDLRRLALHAPESALWCPGALAPPSQPLMPAPDELPPGRPRQGCIPPGACVSSPIVWLSALDRAMNHAQCASGYGRRFSSSARRPADSGRRTSSN